MRPVLRAYVAAVLVAGLLPVLGDVDALAQPTASWNPLVAVALLGLCIIGEHIIFQVQSGWTTRGGTIPHLATALLLPPSLAAIVGAMGMLVYVVVRRQAPVKATFNTASVTLSVGVAAAVAHAFGGAEILVMTGWRGPLVAMLASAAYYLVSVTTVAGVVALDQRRSFIRVLRGKIGMKTLVEVGLGLIGATLAILVITAPAFAPALAVPAALVYLAKRAIDRGAAQTRNLALTNTVGRAVAGTLNLDQAFEAITARDIRDTLRLDGLAVLPLEQPASFAPRIAADRDQPLLRDGLARRIGSGEDRIHLSRSTDVPREWINGLKGGLHIVAAALPCRVGSADPRAALVAWRGGASVEPFDDAELLLMETLADYAAVALETTRLFDEAIVGRHDAEQREARIQAVMRNVADGLLTFDAAGGLESANPAAERIFDVEREVLLGERLSQLLPDLTDADGVPMSVTDSDRVLKREVDGVRGDGSRVPLEVAITAIPQADVPRFIAVVRDVSERRAFEQQLRHMAFHDPLTGLPNRALFLDRIEHALAVAKERNASIGVLFLDVDNFKVVNDSLGHASGDQLLVSIADRLRSSLGSGPTLARFGGDEFTVLLEDVPHQPSPVMVAERLRQALLAPIAVADRAVFATVSIGIAVSDPDTASAGELLRNADVAMYRAKSDGRARSVKFDRSLDADAVERLELETELRAALERGELELHYQPIVELPTQRITDFEALIRWRHPREGLIPPIRFISLAEDSGLIIPIGKWVLETACRQLKIWHDQSGSREMSVSVNISARQFQHPTLLDDIAMALRAANVPPQCLMIEVTESLAMQDASAAAATLAEIKKLGVRVAIDDFGTGYSSLSYLHRFPADVLKIDRSFVSRLGRERHDLAIVEAIVALAHGLDMHVTAEGIETNEQLASLASLGCEAGQGYYFSRPVPAEQVLELLLRQVQADLAEVRLAA